MAERSEGPSTSAMRDDRETLLEIARQITGEMPPRDGDDASKPDATGTVGNTVAPGGADAEGSFEDAKAGMAICARGKILRANPSFALAFGYGSPDALIAAGGLSAIFPTEKPAMEPEAVNGGARQVLEALTRSRRRIKVPVRVQTITGEDGEPAALLVLHPEPEESGASLAPEVTPPAAKPEAEPKEAVARNTSSAELPGPPLQRDAGKPRKTKAKAVHRANGEADFLARVSHDIRIPLNSIIGFAQLMQAEQAGPLGSERYRGYASDILESGECALKLIDDLLIISRIENDSFELNFVSVDLNELINECVAAVHPQAHRERVILRAALDETLPLVLADRPTLERIVLDLLGNAVACTNAGGQVIIESRTKPSGAVQLRVQDSSGGMSEDEIEQALQPLVQRDTTLRKPFGNGLALPLTKALAKANRAKFRLDSVAGRGTRIAVTFPGRRTAAR